MFLPSRFWTKPTSPVGSAPEPPRSQPATMHCFCTYWYSNYDDLKLRALSHMQTTACVRCGIGSKFTSLPVQMHVARFDRHIQTESFRNFRTAYKKLNEYSNICCLQSSGSSHSMHHPLSFSPVGDHQATPRGGVLHRGRPWCLGHLL